MIKRWLLATASWLTILAGGQPARPGSARVLEPVQPPRVSLAALERARAAPLGSPERSEAFRALFPLPDPPKGFDDQSKLAMDAQIDDLYANAGFGWLGEGLGFLGFAYLSELSQRPEYRVITEIRAEEMTRKGIKLVYADDDDDGHGEKILAELREDMQTFHVMERLYTLAEHDGFFGRGQIYIDVKRASDDELKTPLQLAPEKIAKGSLVGFKNIEPIWTYPNNYNSADPLAPNFFRPTQWFVQGKTIHSSRLLTGITREMPDLLKPAYAFAGLSLSQMAKPYVDNWLRTRQSVSDLLHSFSVMILLTNMQSTLEEGDDGSSLFARLDIFNATRDNRGVFAIDKDSEDMKNVSAQIAGVKDLQAQSQEQMAAVSRTPLVKLLGVTPSGLNASSDGEIRVFYDSVLAWQEKLFKAPVKTMLDVLQLNRFGRIDPKVAFEFVPLWQLDEAGKSSVRKTDADTDAVLVSGGIIHPEEARKRIANAPDSPYSGIDVADVPDDPATDPDGEGELDATPSATGDPAKSAEPREQVRSGV